VVLAISSCVVQVDELGGWHESLAAVRSVSGLSADAPLHCVSWPPVLLGCCGGCGCGFGCGGGGGCGRFVV
jgi:hypothetical protein